MAVAHPSRIPAESRAALPRPGSPRIASRAPDESTDPADAQDITDPAEAADPTENAEAAEPIDPMEANDPTEPIERAEPFEAMDRNESSDQSDSELLLRGSSERSEEQPV